MLKHFLKTPVPSCVDTFLLGALAKLRKATVSFVMSVCLSVRMEQLGSYWTDFHEILYLIIFRKSFEKIQSFIRILTRITGTLHEHLSAFIILSQTMASDKNQNSHLMFSNFFFSKKRTVYEIMWKNMVEPDRPQMTV